MKNMDSRQNVFHSSYKITLPPVKVPTKKVSPLPIIQRDPIPKFSVPVVAKTIPKPITKVEKKDTHWTLDKVNKKYKHHWVLQNKDHQINQNYIDSDGNEQHFSLLEAKLQQLNKQKKKGIKTRLFDFVSLLKKTKKTTTFK